MSDLFDGLEVKGIRVDFDKCGKGRVLNGTLEQESKAMPASTVVLSRYAATVQC